MGKTLVAYFSASGVTKKLAELIAAELKADIFEIAPETPYTKADLNWMNKNSRSSVEMRDPSSRPAIAARCENMADYDTVFVGFPIWWYIAPTIINTFLEAHDMSGKKIIVFATSGGSGMGKTADSLKPSLPESAVLYEGKVLNRANAASVAAWIGELKL